MATDRHPFIVQASESPVEALTRKYERRFAESVQAQTDALQKAYDRGFVAGKRDAGEAAFILSASMAVLGLAGGMALAGWWL